MTFDPLALLEVIARHDVEFVLIGGIAASALGSPSVTVDIDICYRRTEDNLVRLATALQELRARLRGTVDEVPFLLDARTLRAGDHFTLSTSLGDLDLVGTPAGTAGYDDVRRNARELQIAGVTVCVAGLEDLIRMKKAAGRPKDRAELEILGALREELEHRADERDRAQ